MHLEPGAAANMSYSAAGYANGGSYRYHFPDGNASIARLLVRDLIPGAIPGHSVEDVVIARADYSKLEVSDSPIRLDRKSTRLNSSHGYISYAVFCLKKKKTHNPVHNRAKPYTVTLYAPHLPNTSTTARASCTREYGVTVTYAVDCEPRRRQPVPCSR